MASQTYLGCPCPPTISFVQRLGSALFYGASSCLITIVNKLVLTTYGFPSFQLLAIGQLTVSIIVLYTARSCGLIRFPHFSENLINKIMPLPIFFFGNLLFGLAGTQAVSLPMFTVLRRFSIWLTMIGEQIILRQPQSLITQSSVYLMLLGAVIAASDDLTFNSFGYGFLLINNFCTAAQGVVIKQKLVSKEFNQNGLLFYNSFVALGPIIVLTAFTEDLTKVWNYDHYDDLGFIFAFLLSSLMGFFLNYSTMLCTNYNSPLTTTVVGACKNMFVTYLGMIIGGDYIYSHVNFLGLNISIIGSLVYSWVTFTRKPLPTTHGNGSSITTVENRKGILMGLITLINGQTTESSLPLSFMNYPIEYEDIDIYNCTTATTTIVPDDTTTICSTSAEITIVTTATTSIALTTKSTTSNLAFVPPKCANQKLGISCNTSSDSCAMMQPCLNLATCYPNTTVPLGYICLCVKGFFGVNCEVDKRVCRPGLTCLYGGTCNKTSNETNCICPTGKTGTHCEYEVDICSNISCKNKGQCVSTYGNWSCLCTNPTLYSGVYCEIKASSLRVKEIVCRSFGGVAIGCIVTVVGFILIMDILKYVFNVDPSGSESHSWKGKRDNQRLQERRKKKINKPKQPVIAIRFHYIHA